MSAEPPGPSSLVSSAFPAPPPFFKHFTPENLSALRNHQKLGTPTDELPPELQYLIPPPPPEKSYRCFGDSWTIPDVLPTLPELGIAQLYPDHPAHPTTTTTATATTTPPPSNTRALSLLRLSKSLLLSYLELISVLSLNPTMSEHKLQDLKAIMINMHHLINEYRPHQARETLILMMEEQVERCRRERDENLKAKETVKGVLRALEGVLGAGLGAREETRVDGEGAGKRVEGEGAKERDAEMWRVLERMR
ncbi:MED7 protein-domain-containing protein [Tirmania nivea]|nr:MED7 protein-domain-containing protein [Tirmania nivea]